MNRIYVFTSTGNSLYSARQIAEKLPDTEIVSIGAEMKKASWKIEGEKVGFVFPCYYGTVPQIVVRFIRDAETVKASYCFGFVSAGRTLGRALSGLGTELNNRGVRLDYGRFFPLASNYMNGWYYSMIMPRQRTLKKRYANASKVIAEGIADIENEVHRIKKGSYLGYVIPATISPRRYVEDTRQWDSEFSVTKACNGCGICAKACPVGNIEIKNGRPEFSHNCQRCMGCLQFCPNQAFVIGKKAMNKPRYLHPQITKKELFAFHME